MNRIWAFPKFIKFSMLSFIFKYCIPFQYLIPKIKSICLSPSIKNLLDFILIWLCLFTKSSPSWCTSISWLILLYVGLGSASSSWTYLITGRAKEAGKTTSVPYTNWKGEVPIDFLVLTLFAHRAKINLEFQAFLFSCNNFLMVLTKLLFDD